MKVVVIGCAGTGGPCSMMLKKLDPSVDLTLIREEENFLTRCAVPYIAVGDATVEASVKGDEMFHKAGTKLIDSKAVKIDREKKTVTTEDGRTFSYDKLVLATGGIPIKPPIPGVDLEGVFTVRTSRDAVNILNRLKEKGDRGVVVIGAGAIGLEMASLIARDGVKVTVVEALDRILAVSLDADMSKEVEGYLSSKGIDFRLNQMAKRILGEKEVEGVELSDGTRIEAGTVILSVGVRANTELASDCGLEIGKFGVKVNKYLQTSDPDIYAGGDLIEYESFITGEKIPGQIRPNAVIGGRIIAKNILGYKIEFPPLLNNFATKLLDKSVAGVGLTEEAAKRAGIDVAVGKFTTGSKHVMIAGRKPFTIKLIFDRATKRLIGGQIVSDSECMVKVIDTVALAIRCRLTALDLTTFRAAGQPELSPEPSAEPITMAAEAVFLDLYPRETK
ncbi:MAG TPA: pyridine nucleotide-disulfide oxidoreductase [Candidatus Syntrophoarchaeum butanivorans]|nr:pyridine nucleotide-disulfide oxidoreductase [Candidatus Syntrophoarchaeum butanivorans]